LLINPYAVDELAQALYAALTMPEAEQERRMRLLRRQVLDNNIYRWAGMLLSEAGKLVQPEVVEEAEATTVSNGVTSGLAGAFR
jgi:trehalose 6-phosphate synthase